MRTLEHLETTYKQLSTGCDQLLGMYLAQQKRSEEVASEVERLTKETAVLTFASTALDQLLNSVSIESLEKLQQLVSYGLRVVFEDQNLAFRIEISNKRGAQWFEPLLVHGNIQGSVLDSFGGGPAAVTDFLLRLLVCRRLNMAPVILLDESFSHVSTTGYYVENVSKLLRELADQLHMTFIVVSHQPGLLKHATRGYEAMETSHGTVMKPLVMK